MSFLRALKKLVGGKADVDKASEVAQGERIKGLRDEERRIRELEELDRMNALAAPENLDPSQQKTDTDEFKTKKTKTSSKTDDETQSVVAQRDAWEDYRGVEELEALEKADALKAPEKIDLDQQISASDLSAEHKARPGKR